MGKEEHCCVESKSQADDLETKAPGKVVNAEVVSQVTGGLRVGLLRGHDLMVLHTLSLQFTLA